MFEKSNNPDRPENWIGNQRPEIFLTGGEPIEFTYNGQRFRIHTVLSSWRERIEEFGHWRIRPTSRPA